MRWTPGLSVLAIAGACVWPGLVVVGTTLEAPDLLAVAACVGLLILGALTAALPSRFYLLGLFVASFAIFLLSRHLIDLVWPGSNSVDSGLVHWTPALQTHVLLSLNLALLGLGTGAGFASHWLRGWISSSHRGRHGRPDHVVSAIRQVGLVMVAVTTPARLIYVAAVALYVREESYFDLYDVAERSVPVPGIVATLGQMNDVAVMAVLATRPGPRTTFAVLGLYLLDGVASLTTLGRATFFLNVLLVVVYLAYRQATRTPDEPHWLRPWAVVAGVAALPLMATVSQALAAQRGRSREVGRGGGPVLDFLHDQGVSVNVIAFTEQFGDQIPEGRWYSLGPLIEFTRYRVLGIVTGETPLVGNNAERALEGNLFSHTVSYLAIPDVYARGSGYGSSFVAELYVDLSYPGVFLGSVVIGALTATFTAMLGWGLVARLLALLMIRQLFFIPRGSFTGFLVNAFDIYNMMALGALTVGAWLLVSHRARDGVPDTTSRAWRTERPRTRAAAGRVRR